MSADRDDLDDLLCTAMKTLDAQVPTGYFDTLPGRTVARLETDMQQSSTSGNREAPSTGVPPIRREDDSGLHDIRSLAQTAKQRITSRRESTQPPLSDDELLASSSASWKNLALPQPAKMVSLPELDQLPSKAEIKAQAKAARAAAAAAPAATAVEPSIATPAPAPAPAPASRPVAAPRSQPSHRNRNLALAGMGLAAAAGIGLFAMTQKKGDVAEQAAPTRKAEAPVAAPPPTVQPIVEAAPVPQVADNAAPSGAAAVGATGGAAAPVEEPTPSPAKVATKHATKPATPARRGAQIAKADTQAPPVETKTAAPGATAKKKGEAGDPSFDALLKEAGVNEQKVAKPVLDKKELSGDDFKKGMSAITARAQACYKSTQGTATVKLVIAPSGKVARVTIGGVFTGKPEAACVAAAVKSATFPPWDGGSQSMGYSFLLSE